MHAEVAADAVACTVVVIHASGPKRKAGKRVEVLAADPFWETRTADRDHALQNKGIASAMLIGGRPHDDRTCDVCGPVHILPATVDKQQFACFHGAVRGLGNAVKHNSAMCARAADCLKTDVA